MLYFSPMDRHPNITKLLQSWSNGDQSSLEQLIPLVYQELHRLAHRALARNRVGNSVQTTVLVHEAYLRLVDLKKIEWQDRVHFFAISANLMRNILVDFARTRLSQKRGGAITHIDLEEASNFTLSGGTDLIALDEVLTKLSLLNERQSKVVELKFFGGLTEEEIAEYLKVSLPTVTRDWHLAKTWLYSRLNEK